MGTLCAIALVVGGFAWFGYLGNQDDWLQQNGRHATAQVVATHEGRSRWNFDPNITVEFITDQGRSVEATLHLAEDSGYVDGQRVDILYDPERPQFARVAGSRSSLPPTAWAAFAMLCAGGLGLIPTVHALLFARRGRRALACPPSDVVVRKSVIRVGRGRTSWLLVEEAGVPLRIRVNRLRRSFLLGAAVQPTPAVMYRLRGRWREFVLIVDPASGQVSGGRPEGLWKRVRRAVWRGRA